MANTQVIFLNGKEQAIKYLFTGSGTSFNYLALGYDSSASGFVDPSIETGASTNFDEIDAPDYQRIELTYHSTDLEKDTGKVLVKFEGTLDYANIQASNSINQLAIVNNGVAGDVSNTDIYAATTFPTFTKNSTTSITFVVGFRF